MYLFIFQSHAYINPTLYRSLKIENIKWGSVPILLYIEEIVLKSIYTMFREVYLFEM